MLSCLTRRRTYRAARALGVVENYVKTLKVIKSKRGHYARRKENYLDSINAFDIESSLLPQQGDKIESAMYVWQMQLGPYITLVGRQWSEYVDVIDTIQRAMPEDSRLIVYVHNLSYEFQFLRSLFQFGQVFCIRARKILRAVSGNIEYRCSYLLSNSSLSRWCKDMKVKHRKLAGDDFDYRAQRYSWTPLTVKQLQYSIVDVISLTECVAERLKQDGDNLRTIPLTSTGYVRRIVKHAIYPLQHTKLADMRESPEIYGLLREAFRGGDTHANRFYAGIIVDDVKSVDKSSSYPASLCLYKYPMSAWKSCISTDIAHIESLIDKGYALLFRAKFSGLRLKDELWGFPYVPLAKCRHVRGNHDDLAKNFLPTDLDNGRILEAQSLEITLTDIDYGIIKDEYVWDDIEISDVWMSRYDYLPNELVSCIWQLYCNKTKLKYGDPVKYALSKALVNAIYGMMAERADKDDVVIDGWDYIKQPVDLVKALNNKMLPYSWGVWTTAISRRELHAGLHAAGYGALYCDTDSVKYIGKCDMTNYNADLVRGCKERLGDALDTKGDAHYLGVYEDDGKYKQFVTWGAKKYAYDDGDIHITIAGVGKKDGALELAKKGGLKALEPGMVFREGGGLRAIYNDHPVEFRQIDGHRVVVTSNTALVPDTYEFGLSDDYYQLLSVINGNILWWRDVS